MNTDTDTGHLHVDIVQEHSVKTISANVIDYPARDMTITVRGEMSFGELQDVLRAEKQQLPIDVADDAITVARMVDEDVSGPRQFGYGSLRDYVIGIEAVDGHGRVFHAGGRVVKNVAGYDLCRLLVGARGELGSITQLTFKLKPTPEWSSLVFAGFENLDSLDAALLKLNLTETTPVIFDVFNRTALTETLPALGAGNTLSQSFDDFPAVVVMGFEGPEQACHWQEEKLRYELQETAATTGVLHDSAVSGNYCRIIQRYTFDTGQVSWMARVSTLPSKTVTVIREFENVDCVVFGRAGGTLYVRPASCVPSSASSSTDSSAAQENRRPDETESIQKLKRIVVPAHGTITAVKGESDDNTKSGAAIEQLSLSLRQALGAGLRS